MITRIREKRGLLEKKQCGLARKMDRAFAELYQAMPAGKHIALDVLRCEEQGARMGSELCCGDVGLRASRDCSSVHSIDMWSVSVDVDVGQAVILNNVDRSLSDEAHARVPVRGFRLYRALPLLRRSG